MLNRPEIIYEVAESQFIEFNNKLTSLGLFVELCNITDGRGIKWAIKLVFQSEVDKTLTKIMMADYKEYKFKIMHYRIQ